MHDPTALLRDRAAPFGADGGCGRPATQRRHTGGTWRATRLPTLAAMSTQTLPPRAPARGPLPPVPASRTAGSPLAATPPAPAGTWRLRAAGQDLTVRRATATDLPALAGLLVRCSPTTRLGAFGRGGTVPPLARQEAWLRTPSSLVVELVPGRLVAMGAAHPATCEGGDDPVAGAVEVLVDDAWQRRGIGSALVVPLASGLAAGGRSELQATAEADRTAAEALLARLGRRVRQQRHAHGPCPRVHTTSEHLDALAGALRAAGAAPRGVVPASRRGATG